MKYISVAKIRRPHSLHGAVIAQVLKKKEFDENLNNIFYIDLMGEIIEMKIEKIFGYVGSVCRIKFKDFDGIDSVEEFRNVFLNIGVSDDTFVLEDIIGMQVFDGKMYMGTISSVNDFGAGIVIDTENEMFSINELDLENMSRGVIKLINQYDE